MRRPLSAVLALLLVAPIPAQDRPLLVPRRELKPLESEVGALARAGQGAAMRELLAVLELLGCPREELKKLEKQAEAIIKRARPGPAKGSATDLAKSATALAVHLDRLQGAEKTQLAELLLRLDSACEPAHLALGHEREGSGWTTPRARAMRARAAAIQDRLAAVRRLDIPLEVDTAENPTIRAIYQRPATRVRAGGVTVLSIWPADQLARMVREALRGTALSAWLCTDAFGLDARRHGTWVLLDSADAWVQWIREAHAAGALGDPESKEAGQYVGYGDGRGWRACYATGESDGITLLFSEFTVVAPPLDSAQPALVAGHGNWVCLALWGVPMMQYAYREGAAGHSRELGKDPELDRTSRLSDAGLPGRREHLALLARRRADPPFAHCLEAQIGKIDGERLLKCLGVVEYLHELGPLGPVLEQSQSPEMADKPARASFFARAVGKPVADFEAEWREWIAPSGGGLAQRVGQAPAAALPAEGPVVARLNQLRREAMTPFHGAAPAPVTMHAEASLGVRAHADYLLANPGAAERWPDVRDERVGQPGFTAEGAWHGSRSLVATNCADDADALAAWMGAWPHRAALLAPGLKAVGWGLQEKLAVLDAESYVGPVDYRYRFGCPTEGAQNVPRYGTRCTPVAVTGADPRSCGYPVTFHAFVDDKSRDVALSLHVGTHTAAPVACFTSSPGAPLVPDWAPSDVWCLIPKEPLQARTTYVVVARFTGTDEVRSWEWKTGP